MKVSYSISQVDVAGRPTYISTIKGFGIRRSLDVINQYLSEGRGGIKAGLALFANKRDSEAAPRIELGSHFLYLISTAENIEQTGDKKQTPISEVLSRDEKIKLFYESLESGEITNLIYAKKLFTLYGIAKPEILERAVIDSSLRDGLNRMLDELFKEHKRFLPHYTGTITASIIKGIKMRLVGDAYICLSKGYRPTVNREKIHFSLQTYGINTNDDFGRLYDGNDFLTSARKLIEKANSILEPIDHDTELNSTDINNTLDLAKQNNRGINGTPASELFYSKLLIAPLILQPFGQSIITSSFTTTTTPQPTEPQKFIPNKALVNVAEQKESTAYENWVRSKIQEPFPAIQLTKGDIDNIFSHEKTERKNLFLRYHQLLNNGALPHSDNSPRKSRLFLHNSERRAFDGINSFLQGKNITPMILFSSENQTLRLLYSAYREIKRQSNTANITLEENYSPKQLENICLYLERNNEPTNRDEDFRKLTQIEPDFASTVLSNEFLNHLLEIATRPKLKQQTTILEQQNNDEPTEQVQEVHYNEERIESEQQQYPVLQKAGTVESIQFTNTPVIREIKIPLLDLLGYSNYSETGKIPGGEELVVTFKGKKHIFGTHGEVHDEVHNYHKGKHTVRVTVTYSDGSKKDIRPYITNVKHALKELKEFGQSTYILKDHHESS